MKTAAIWLFTLGMTGFALTAVSALAPGTQAVSPELFRELAIPASCAFLIMGAIFHVGGTLAERLDRYAARPPAERIVVMPAPAPAPRRAEGWVTELIDVAPETASTAMIGRSFALAADGTELVALDGVTRIGRLSVSDREQIERKGGPSHFLARCRRRVDEERCTMSVRIVERD